MTTKKILLLVITIFTIGIAKAQSSDDILNLLIQKGLVKQNDADSIRADYAFKQQEVKEKQKLFNVLSSRNINIGGAIQVRYQSLQEPGKADGFDIRRARFDIKGNFSPEWEYRLQTDFAINTKIIDAYFFYKPFDYLKITGGQFLIPNSLESTTSDSALETIDRAQISGLTGRNKDALGDQNGRDIGLQASGSLFKTTSNRYLLDYYLAYFDGQGINIAADKNESKDIAARIVAHPYEFLDFGISYSNGHDSWSTPAKNQDQIRIGADISVNYNDFSLRAEYLQAQQGTYIVNGVNRDLLKDGWYAQVGYFVLPKKLQFVAKYDTFDPTKNNPKNDITSFYILGANLYPNSFVKFQVNYKHKSEQGFSINKDEIIAQLQIKF
ncbi:porin [Flavobacterium xinjiangense]|uniref:Phosphate-selective porin n=1 Tax=Flavobacterium xinjiangense TaxID=178356 RepID=A0A1M7DHC5_9FLAO|nr:porin [Flavobacterium xinjiangense]SHL78753.1 Phosphate-selective porin [Flavobacterium xinjiangense]